MTVLEALRSLVKYPLDEGALKVVLIDRELCEYDEYCAELGKSKQFQGARADCYRELLDAPNITEGGLSISISEKAIIEKIANGIYAKIGEPLIGQDIDTKTPTVTAICE